MKLIIAFLFVMTFVEGSRIFEDYFVTTSLTSGNQGSGALMASHPTVPNVAYAATSRAFESDTPDNGFSVFAVDIRPGSVTQLGDFYNTTFTSPNGQMAVALAATENNLLVFSIDTTIGAKAPWLTRIPFYSNKSLNLDSVVGPTYIGDTVGVLLYRVVALPNEDNSGYHVYATTSDAPYIWISTDEGSSWEGASTYALNECFISIFSFPKLPAFSASPDGTLLSVSCGVASSNYYVDIWERNTTTGNLVMVAFATPRATVTGATRSTISSDAYLLSNAVASAATDFAWHPTAPRVYFHSTEGTGPMHALDWNGTHLTATTFEYDGYTFANTNPQNGLAGSLGGTQPFKSFYFSIPPDGLSLYTFRSDIGIVTYDIDQDDLSLLLATNGTIVGDLASPSDIRSLFVTPNGRFFIFSHGATEEAKVNVFTRESRILSAGSSSVSFSRSASFESHGALLYQHPTLSDIVYAASGKELSDDHDTRFSVFALNVSGGIPEIVGDIFNSPLLNGVGLSVTSLVATETNLIIFASRDDPVYFESAVYQTTVSILNNGYLNISNFTGPVDRYLPLSSVVVKANSFLSEDGSLYHIYVNTGNALYLSIDEGLNWAEAAYKDFTFACNHQWPDRPPTGSFSLDGSLLVMGCGPTLGRVDIWTRNATDGSLTIAAFVTGYSNMPVVGLFELPSSAKLFNFAFTRGAYDFAWHPNAPIVYYSCRGLSPFNIVYIEWNGTHVSASALPFTGYSQAVTDPNFPYTSEFAASESDNRVGPAKSFYFHIPPDGSALYTWRTDKGVISYTIDPDDPTSLTFATNGTLNGFAADDPSQIRDIMTTQDSTYLLVSYGELGTAYVDALVIDFITEPPVFGSFPSFYVITVNPSWTFPETANETSIMLTLTAQSSSGFYLPLVDYTFSFTQLATSISFSSLVALTDTASYTVSPSGSIINQGYYTFTISYSDSFNNPTASDIESNILIDPVTIPPLLVSPTDGLLVTHGQTLTINYTLYERMSLVNLNLNLNNLQISTSGKTAGTHEIILDPKNINRDPYFDFINGGSDTLVLADGLYDIYVEATDLIENSPIDSETVTITIDMLTTPPVLDAIPSVLAGTSRTFSWTIPDTPLNDSIVFTMTGQSHPNYLPPKTYTWTFSDTATSLLVPFTTPLTDGAQYSVTPSGEIIQQGYYTVTITYTDFRNNPNASDSQADVQVDGTTLAPLLASPIDGQILVNADTLDIEYTLYEQMSHLEFHVGEDILRLTPSVRSVGTHSFSMDPKNIVTSFAVNFINFGTTPLSLEDGSYDVYIIATDFLENTPTSSETVSITIDTTTLDPVIVNSNGTLTARCEFTLDVTLDEIFSSLYFALDNGTAVVLLEASEDTSVQYALDCDEFPALAEPGYHEITVYGQDAYSNPVATSSITILVIGAPFPFINHPSNGTAIEEENLYLITEIDAKEYNTSWVQLRINEQKVDQVLAKNTFSNCSGDNLEFSVFLPLNYSHLLSSSGEQKLQICAYENLLQTMVCSQPVYIYMVPEETITCFNITTTVNQTETVYINSTETVYVNSTKTAAAADETGSYADDPFIIFVFLVTTISIVLNVAFGSILASSRVYFKVSSK